MNTRPRFNADNSANIKVLCVDDNFFRLYLTGILLEHADNRLLVKTSTSAADALHTLANEAFDAVVCDFEMPEIDSLVLLEQLRSNGNMIPFILLTAHSREDIAAHAMNLGVSHFINKSKNLKSLFSVLARAIISEVERNRAA